MLWSSKRNFQASKKKRKKTPTQTERKMNLRLRIILKALLAGAMGMAVS
jgi:hypothetical protein